jgi:hypothetical protein
VSHSRRIIKGSARKATAGDHQAAASPGFLCGASGSRAQKKYVGIMWRLLYPAEGSRYNFKMSL